jgi:hypothetical protein
LRDRELAGVSFTQTHSEHFSINKYCENQQLVKVIEETRFNVNYRRVADRGSDERNENIQSNSPESERD